jgi:hypothetical protein
VLLEENGSLIMDGLINGIAGRIGDLRGLLGGLTLEMPRMLGSAAIALPSSAARTANVRAGIAQASASPAAPPNVNAKIMVMIGDREITDIVGTQIDLFSDDTALGMTAGQWA